MTTPHAILLGCGLVSLSIFAHSAVRPAPRYQVAQYLPGMVVRVDTATGALALCGHDKFALRMITVPPHIVWLEESGADPGLIKQLTDQHIADVKWHSCVPFSDPVGPAPSGNKLPSVEDVLGSPPEMRDP